MIVVAENFQKELLLEMEEAKEKVINLLDGKKIIQENQIEEILINPFPIWIILMEDSNLSEDLKLEAIL